MTETAREGPGTEPSRRGPRFATFAALQAENYRRYWLGLILYVVGYNAEFVTFAWLVWLLTENPLYLGYLGLAQGVPTLVFQLLGGVLADRVQRMRLLLSTQVVMSLLVTVAFALTVTGYVRVEHLLLLSVLSGVFRAFQEPTRFALLPHLIDRAHLANAIALGSIPWQSGRILGPAIAGVLIAALGGAAGFALSAAAYYGSLALYTRIHLKQEASASASHSMFQNFVEGFAFVGQNVLMASLIGLTFVNTLFGMSFITLLPIFADRYLDAGSGGYGIMQAASGVGAVIGTLTIASVAHRLRKRGRFLLAGGAGFGLLLMLFSQSPVMLFALVVLAAAGFSNTFYMTLVNTLLQQRVPDALRGRVMGIYGLCWNLIPIGGMVGGALAAAVDARFAVLLGGSVVAAMALVMFTFSRQVRTVE